MLEAERLEKLCAATEVQRSGAQVVQMVCAKHVFHGLQTFQSCSDLSQKNVSGSGGTKDTQLPRTLRLRFSSYVVLPRCPL